MQLEVIEPTLDVVASEFPLVGSDQLAELLREDEPALDPEPSFREWPFSHD